MAESFWEKVTESNLHQGDHLPDCAVPIFLDPSPTSKTQQVPIDVFDLIVLTQSCDLEQNKVRLVAMCPIAPIRAFEEKNPEYKKKPSLRVPRQTCNRTRSPLETKIAIP
jgi:hypothetical protein